MPVVTVRLIDCACIFFFSLLSKLILEWLVRQVVFWAQCLSFSTTRIHLCARPPGTARKETMAELTRVTSLVYRIDLVFVSINLTRPFSGGFGSC